MKMMMKIMRGESKKSCRPRIRIIINMIHIIFIIIIIIRIEIIYATLLSWVNTNDDPIRTDTDGE